MAPKRKLKAIGRVERSKMVGTGSDVISATQEADLALLEASVHSWMELVLETEIDLPLMESLRNGQIICSLANKIQPKIIKRVHKMSMPFMQMENITMFCEACVKLGVHESQVFDTSQLYEATNKRAVITTIYELARVSSERGFKVKIKPIEELDESAELQAKEELEKMEELLNEEPEDMEMSDIEMPEEPVEEFEDVDFDEPIDLGEDEVDESGANTVYFEVNGAPIDVDDGDRLFVVGSIPELGEWDVEGALELEEGEDYGVFSGTMNAAPEYFYFKFVVYKGEDEEYEWEDAFPRCRVIDDVERESAFEVVCNWRDAEDEDHVIYLTLEDKTRVLFTIDYAKFEGDYDSIDYEDVDDDVSFAIGDGGVSRLLFSNVAHKTDEPTEWKFQCEKVVGIDLSYVWMTDEAVLAIMSLFENLSQVNLEGCPDISGVLNDGLIEMSDRLTSLNISRCKNFTADDVLNSINSAGMLNELRVGLCTKLDDAFLDAALEPFVGQMQVLDISQLNRLTTMCAPIISELSLLKELNVKELSCIAKELVKILSNMKHLEKLNLSGLTLNETILSKLVSCPLRHIVLEWCSVEDEALDHLSKITGLTHVDLSNNEDITDEGVSKLASGPFASALVDIQLDGCPSITETSVVPILEIARETIMLVNVEGTECSSAVVDAAAECTNLESLTLAKILGLDGASLVQLAPLVNLKSLSVRDCGDSVTLEHITNFINARPVSDCTELQLECGGCEEEIEDEVDDLKEINERIDIVV
ncbi:hypothetical protein PCE1_004271 [Barthelona sp. PCE]